MTVKSTMRKTALAIVRSFCGDKSNTQIVTLRTALHTPTGMAGLAVQMVTEFAEEPSPMLLVTQVGAFAVIP